VAAAATAAPAVGGEAVQRSEAEKNLSAAQAPAAVALPAQAVEMAGARDQSGSLISPVKYVGDKTFIFSQGTWTDTTFDSDKMAPVPVGFGTDDYFALIAARPEWGKYLAVGDHVIVVLAGTAYEVREGDAPPLSVPAVTPATTPQGDLIEAVIQLVVDVVKSVTVRIQQ